MHSVYLTAEIRIKSPLFGFRREDLRMLVRSYLDGLGAAPPIDPVVDFYQTAKKEAESSGLVDGAGLRPSYSLRTLCRALEFVRHAAPM